MYKIVLIVFLILPNMILSKNNSGGKICGTSPIRDHDIEEAIIRTQKLRPNIPPGLEVTPKRTPQDTIGTRRDFYVYDGVHKVFNQRTFILKARSIFANVWLDTSETAIIKSDIDTIITYLSGKTPSGSQNPAKGILPLDIEYFGLPPYKDGDDITDFLLTDIPDPKVKGFFLKHDQTDKEFSNRRDILYIDTPQIYNHSLRAKNILGTCAHEFQHLIHYRYDKYETSFVNEGLSEIAEVICGFPLWDPSDFFNDLDSPDMGLFSWSETDGGLSDDYARAALFTLYYWEQLGNSVLRKVVQDTLIERDGLNHAFKSVNPKLTFEDIFVNFCIANYVQDTSIDARYGYRNPAVTGTPTHKKVHESFEKSVHENINISRYTAHYIKFYPINKGRIIKFNYNKIYKLVVKKITLTTPKKVTAQSSDIAYFSPRNIETVFAVVHIDIDSLFINYSYQSIGAGDSSITEIGPGEIYGGVKSSGVALFHYNTLTRGSFPEPGDELLSEIYYIDRSSLDSKVIWRGTYFDTLDYTFSYGEVLSLDPPFLIHADNSAEVAWKERFHKNEQFNDQNIWRIKIYDQQGTIKTIQSDTGIAYHVLLGVDQGNVWVLDTQDFSTHKILKIDVNGGETNVGNVQVLTSLYDFSANGDFAAWIKERLPEFTEIILYKNKSLHIVTSADSLSISHRFYNLSLGDRYLVWAQRWVAGDTHALFIFNINSGSIESSWGDSTTTIWDAKTIDRRVVFAFRKCVDFGQGEYLTRWGIAKWEGGTVDTIWSFDEQPSSYYEIRLKLDPSGIYWLVNQDSISYEHIYNCTIFYAPFSNLNEIRKIKLSDAQIFPAMYFANIISTGPGQYPLTSKAAPVDSGRIFVTLEEVKKADKYGRIPSQVYYLNMMKASVITGVQAGRISQTVRFELSQNYPNPFNPVTTIKFSLPYNIRVTLKIYDILGREVKTLIDGEKPSGIYEINFDASALSSGIYFYRMIAGDYVETRKMVLLK